MHKFGIVGYGVVGKATEKSLLNDKTVVVHDILQKTKIDILKDCSVVFICIPTDTTQDILNLIEICVNLIKLNSKTEIIIRCTVPIGTCARIESILNRSIYYMPEFLRDRMWDTDCMKRPIILGSKNKTIPEWLKHEDIEVCTLEEAELVKMFSNNYSSMRIVFANHFFDLANKVDANYDKVLDMHQKTIHNQSYLEVNDSLRGFGGKCLTKDLNYLIETFEEYNLDQKLFSAIKEDNTKWPTTVRES